MASPPRPTVTPPVSMDSKPPSQPTKPKMTDSLPTAQEVGAVPSVLHVGPLKDEISKENIYDISTKRLQEINYKVRTAMVTQIQDIVGKMMREEIVRAAYLSRTEVCHTFMPNEYLKNVMESSGDSLIARTKSIVISEARRVAHEIGVNVNIRNFEGRNWITFDWTLYPNIVNGTPNTSGMNGKVDEKTPLLAESKEARDYAASFP